MGESNAEWGALAALDDHEFAAAWDKANILPEPGQNPELDNFLSAKHLEINDLIRIGTRIQPDGVTLTFASDGGIKYRRITDNMRWAMPDSVMDLPKIIQRGPEPAKTVVLVEGETDGARLSAAPYDFDVAIMLAGAGKFTAEGAEHLSAYSQVLIGLDNDEAGDKGAEKILAKIPHAQRWKPLNKDWCEQPPGEWPELPDPAEAPKPMQIIVKAADLFELEVPDINSWFSDAILPIGGSAFIHGWAKNYKSFVALDMLSMLAQGLPWCEFDPTNEPAKTCAMQFEIPFPYYVERAQQLYSQAVEPQLFLENFTTYSPVVRPKIVAGDAKAEDVILNHLIENGINVFLIDPLRRATGGADLNDEKEVRALLSFIERINDNGITTIVVHHDNKSGAQAGGGGPISMTGSGAFAGDPDTIFSIVRPPGHNESSPHRNMEFTIRNGPMITPRGFSMEDDQLKYQPNPWNDGEDEEGKEPGI